MGKHNHITSAHLHHSDGLFLFAETVLAFSSQSKSQRASRSHSTVKMSTDLCPVYAPFFGAMGCTSAIVFTCLGAAYGTAKSGVGISAMGVLRPDLIVKNIVPVIMAGIIGIVGVWCSRYRTTTSPLRWHDSHSYLRRSPRSLRLDCGPAHELEG